MFVDSLESRTMLTSPTGSNPQVEFLTRSALDVTFDLDVSASLDVGAGDLQVINLMTLPDEPVAYSNIEKTYPGGSNATAVFRFINTLSNGNYRASISYQDVQNGNDLMTGDVIWDNHSPQNFFILAGDADRSRQVDIGDLAILATNWQTAGDWSMGDFNYDGFVDIGDLAILATNWQAIVYEAPQGPNVLEVQNAGGANGSRELVLNWDANAAPSGTTAWRIQRSPDGQTFSQYADVPVADVQGGVFIDDGDADPDETGPGLSDGTRLWYRVRPLAGSTQTAYTPKRGGTTKLPAPESLVVQRVSGSELMLEWTDTSQSETRFDVHSSPDGITEGPKIGEVAHGQPNEFIVTVPTPYVRQFFYVRAHNEVADSAPSNFASSAPAAPTGLSVSLNETPLSLELDWGDNTEAGVIYNVYRSTELSFVADPATNLIQAGLTASFYSDATVLADTRYYYQVSAAISGQEQTGGQSFPSSPATQTTTARGAPGSLFAEVIDENNVQLTWQDNSVFETRFYVEQEVAPNQWQTISPDLGPRRTHYLVENLSPETEYTFRVGSDFLGIDPKFSAPVSTTTDAFGDKTELVIAVLGHSQSMNDLPTSVNDRSKGMTSIALRLRALHDARVIRVSEDKDDYPQIEADGTGPVLDWAVGQVQGSNGILRVAVIGYSHGAHTAKRLAERLNSQLGILQDITYTAYIDAIERFPVTLIDELLPSPLRDAPSISTDWHDNFYNVAPFQLFGPPNVANPLKGVAVNGSNNNNPNNLTHFVIDDDVSIQDQLIDNLTTYVNLP